MLVYGGILAMVGQKSALIHQVFRVATLPTIEWKSVWPREIHRKKIILKCGVYEKVDTPISVREMCDKAALALGSIKENYSRKYAMYDGPVSQKQFPDNYERYLVYAERCGD